MENSGNNHPEVTRTPYALRVDMLRAMDVELAKFLGPHTKLRLALKDEIERTQRLIEFAEIVTF